MKTNLITWLSAAAVSISVASCSSSSGNGSNADKSQSFDELTTTNPSPEAAKVYDYLRSVYGEKVLSGTMANVNWNDAEARLVETATGKWPAIIGLDYIDVTYAESDSASAQLKRDLYADLTVAQDHWQKGGLVSICWHWSVPAGPDSTRLVFYTDTQFKVENMFTEGAWENHVMERDIDMVIAQLMKLKKAGIPVIWRPLHEASGNHKSGGKEWFWWGNGGAENYVRLWRHLYDRCAKAGLDNLIWVWTTQTGFGDDLTMGILADTTWYPGDQYVDMVGRDAYTRTSQQLVDEYNAIRATFPRKMAILSECGTVGRISEQWEMGAKWGLFIPWYTYQAKSLKGHLYADDDWWTDAAKCPDVVWRGQLGLNL